MKRLMSWMSLFLFAMVFNCDTSGPPEAEGSQQMLQAQTGFVTQWTVSGDADGRTVVLPLAQASAERTLAYNFVVTWGDNNSATVTAYNDINARHTYANPGTYRVEITGTCEGWSFDPLDTMPLKLTAIVSWGSPTKFGGFQYLWNGFGGCSNLTSLPYGGILASKNGGPGVQSQGFANTFANNTKLAAIPYDLFSRHPKAGDFSNVFQYDSNLTSIPTGLFRYNVAATSFNGALSYCTKLTTVPANTFLYNAAVKSFANLFSADAALATIPVDLFRYNVAATSFDGAFRDCSNLTSVPANTFRYNKAKAISFSYTFFNDTKLKIGPNIFFANGEEATRFAGNTSTDLSGYFFRNTYAGTAGTAPALWNCTFGGTLKSSAAFGGAGNNATSVTNYSSIPTGWIQ
jgi:hypothetical protein